MSHKIVHVEIMGPDGDELAVFYKELFGWELETMPGFEGYNMFDGEQTGIGGAVGTGNENMPSYVAAYVEVDDINAYLTKAEASGAKTLIPRTEIPEVVTFAIFADPAGNPTGLVEATAG